MQLLKEIKDRGYDVKSSTTKVTCRLSEDNPGALELARFPKMRPRTKHINQMCHHFRSCVADKLIEIFPIDTAQHLGDVFTKTLPRDQFRKLRFKLMVF